MPLAAMLEWKFICVYLCRKFYEHSVTLNVLCNNISSSYKVAVAYSDDIMWRLHALIIKILTVSTWL